jgi:hypothetical protein
VTHPRKAARAAVQAALAVAWPDYNFRPAPYRPGDVSSLPAYEIATPRTDIAHEAVGDEAQDIRLEIVLRIPGTDRVYDDLDDICQPIEAVVLTALLIIFQDAELKRVETALASDGPEPIGLMLLTFNARALVAVGNQT